MIPSVNLERLKKLLEELKKLPSSYTKQAGYELKFIFINFKDTLSYIKESHIGVRSELNDVESDIKFVIANTKKHSPNRYLSAKSKLKTYITAVINEGKWEDGS